MEPEYDTEGLPGNGPDDGDEYVIPFDGNEGGGSHIPAGEYRGRVVDVKRKYSQSNNLMYVWKFDVVDADDKKLTALWYNMVIVKSAMWKVAQVMNALGYDSSKPLAFTREDAVGREAMLRVVDDEYNGTTRSQISSARKV